MTETPDPDHATIHEETDNPILADDRNYYKVEKWTKDGTKNLKLTFQLDHSVGADQGTGCGKAPAPRDSQRTPTPLPAALVASIVGT